MEKDVNRTMSRLSTWLEPLPDCGNWGCVEWNAPLIWEAKGVSWRSVLKINTKSLQAPAMLLKFVYCWTFYLGRSGVNGGSSVCFSVCGFTRLRFLQIQSKKTKEVISYYEMMQFVKSICERSSLYVFSNKVPHPLYLKFIKMTRQHVLTIFFVTQNHKISHVKL